MFVADDLSSLRWDSTGGGVEIIDQTLLPHTLRWCHLPELSDFCHAISSMQVRGAPLIGITAAYGLARALVDDASDDNLQRARQTLAATRPTAINLQWALDQVTQAVEQLPVARRAEAQPTLRFDEAGPAYETPPLSLLASPDRIERHHLSDEALEENARMLENVLDDYGLELVASKASGLEDLKLEDLVARLPDGLATALRCWRQPGC